MTSVLTGALWSLEDMSSQHNCTHRDGSAWGGREGEGGRGGVNEEREGKRKMGGIPNGIKNWCIHGI